MPFKQIARFAGISKNSVIYRIKKLQEDGIIRKALPIVNHELLGIKLHQIFIKLRATEKQEAEIVKYFNNHPNIVWWGTLFGKWDLFIQVLTWSDIEFSDILRKICLKLGKQLDIYQVNAIFERTKIHHQLFDLGSKANYEFKRPVVGLSKQPVLDQLDKKILNYLNQNNGFANYAQVGKDLKISMETARNRMRALLKNGSIIRYMVFLNHKKIGISQYLVSVSFRNITPEREKEFIDFISPSKKIIIIFKTGEKIEYHMFIAIESHYELERFMRSIRNEFFGEISEIDHSLLTEEYDLNYFPRGLL